MQNQAQISLSLSPQYVSHRSTFQIVQMQNVFSQTAAEVSQPGPPEEQTDAAEKQEKRVQSERTR